MEWLYKLQNIFIELVYLADDISFDYFFKVIFVFVFQKKKKK